MFILDRLTERKRKIEVSDFEVKMSICRVDVVRMYDIIYLLTGVNIIINHYIGRRRKENR
jgi:hypothetical protein